MKSRAPRTGSIQHGERFIDYEIIHRPKVTSRIHLKMGDDGVLKVVAPTTMSLKTVRTTLQKKSQRVARFLIEAEARQRDLKNLQYVSGEKHLFLGKSYVLDVREEWLPKNKAGLTGDAIFIATRDIDPKHIKMLLAKWYRKQAERHLKIRLAIYCREAPWVGNQFPPMRLRKMSKSWGSCSTKGLITFNPKIIKAPPELVDYVVAHEVCHLQQHNHSKEFYDLLEQIYPGWKEARALLKSKGHIFMHE
jgi:predicted metal-dependent hydrolase